LGHSFFINNIVWAIFSNTNGNRLFLAYHGISHRISEYPFFKLYEFVAIGYETI